MAHELVDLVPWDPESADHIDRLVEQRYQCGWAYGRDLIGKTWKDAHLAGTKCMYWIVRSLFHESHQSTSNPQS